MQDLTPRQRDKHERITAAAVEVFAEKGFHQARVADIAKRAGVADGTIYLYFKNKEDILLSVFEEKMDLFVAGVTEALQGVHDPVERVLTFATFHATRVEHDRPVAEVLQVELRLSNKFLREYRPTKLWAYLGILQTIIEQGQADGVFDATIDPFVATWALFGALDELGMQWVLSRKARRFPPAEVATQVTNTFLRGLVRVPDPKTTMEAS